MNINLHFTIYRRVEDLKRQELKCVLCVLIELIECPYSQGRVVYTVINQITRNTSG